MNAGRIFTTATISTTSTNSYNRKDKENEKHHHRNHPCLEPRRIFWEDQCSFFFFFKLVSCQRFDVYYIVVHKQPPNFSSHLLSFLLLGDEKNDKTVKTCYSQSIFLMISCVLFKGLFLVFLLYFL